MSQILIQNLDFTYDGDHTPVFERTTGTTPRSLNA